MSEIGPGDFGPSAGVVAALDRLWRWYPGDQYGLLPDLAVDAVLARSIPAGDQDEARRCVPRLAELLATGAVPVDRAREVVAVVMTVAEASFDDGRDVRALLDAWWDQTLRTEPGHHAEGYEPDTVLALLAGTGIPMRHWFDPWLAELDGPGVLHLASVILDGRRSALWDGLDDEAGQVLAWARSETVLNGVTLIGAPHIPRDTFSRLLDVLI